MQEGAAAGTDWATWAGAIVAWIGVVVSGFFAWKSQRHAEAADAANRALTLKLHAETTAQTERLSQEAGERAERMRQEEAERAERLSAEAAARATAEKADEHRAKARALFVSICGMKLSEGSRRVLDQADALYNLLGDSPEARYITSTAFAFAAYGDPSWGNAAREAGLAKERDGVLAFLTGSASMMPIPATGQVREYFRPAPPGTSDASAFRNRRWVLRPTD
jgi:hypothetical protein